MTRALSLVALLALLAQAGLPLSMPVRDAGPLVPVQQETPSAFTSPILEGGPDSSLPPDQTTSPETQLPPVELTTTETATETLSIPYPDPAQPIPYNKTGYPSKMDLATRLKIAREDARWSAQISALSPEEVEKALDFNADIDPFTGNYNLVDWDSLAVVAPGATNQWIRTWKGYEDPNNDALQAQVDVLSGVKMPGWTRVADINNDGADEIVTAGNPTNGVYPVVVGNFAVANETINRRTSKGAPAIASPRAGGLWRFARGYDDQLWMRRGAEWEPLGGNLISAPTAVSPAPDRVDVLMLQADGHVWRCLLTVTKPTCDWSSQNDDWGIAPSGSFVGEPSMSVISGVSVHDVFVRGSDNTVWHKAWRNGWSNWENIGGYIVSSPVATVVDGQIVVAAVGFDGAIWTTSRAVDGSAWAAWEAVAGGPQFATAPAVVSTGPGMLDLYAVDLQIDVNGGTHPALMRNQKRNGAWQGWSPVATPKAPASPPAATAYRDSASGANGAHLNYLAADGYTYVSNLTVTQFTREKPLGVWSRQYPRENFGTFELGRFIANGKTQAVAYYRQGNQLFLQLYRFDAGFGPQAYVRSAATGKPDPIVITLEHSGSDDALWATVGDFDGGAQELAILYRSGTKLDLYLFKFNSDGALAFPANQAKKYSKDCQHDGFFSLTSGDYDLDGWDEIAEVERYYEGKQICAINVLGVPTSGGQFTLDAPVTGTDDTCDIDEALAATSGNFVKDEASDTIRDEIAVAGIRHWLQWGFNHYYLYRSVWRLGQDGKLAKHQENGDLLLFKHMGGGKPSYFHTSIAAVNLQRSDVTDPRKIAIFLDYGPYVDSSSVTRTLYTYGADDQGKFTRETVQSVYGTDDSQVPEASMVAGNLTGEGLRLAKPTYRLARNVGQPVASVNAPPKLWDIDYVNPTDGYVYDRHLINPDSYISIGFTESQEQQLTTEAASRLGVDVKGSAKWGPKSANVTVSLGVSVGADFSKLSDSTRGSQFKWLIKTTEDQFVTSATDYHLYEFPALDGASAELTHLSAALPKAGAVVMSVKTVSACGMAFDPGHDQRNLLSYPSTPLELPLYQPERLLGSVTSQQVGSDQRTFDVKVTAQETLKRTQKLKFEVTGGVEGKIKTPVHELTGSIKGAYGQDNATTQTVTVGKETAIGGSFEPIKLMQGERPDKYNHEVTPYYYWSGETLMLNYTAMPGTSTWWTTGFADSDGWTKPDLAFVRPWVGKSCFDANGRDRTDFSPEIVFDRDAVPVNEKVKVTATLRNFSDTSTLNAVVRFYDNDPASGGKPLTCDPAIEPVQLGARGKWPVSCSFVPSGSGEHRIYAVADPDAVINEHYEDNNKAFGMLVVAQPGSASGADPGLAGEKPGKIYTLRVAPDAVTTVFVPYKAMAESAVSNYKLDSITTSPLAFEIAKMREDAGGVWTKAEATFGLNTNLTRDPNVPTAWARVMYPSSLVVPSGKQLGLFYNYNGAWVSNEVFCGAAVIDATQRTVQGPICRTGVYALVIPEQHKVYLPMTGK